MSFHKRSTYDRVRSHLNRSPTLDLSHRAVDPVLLTPAEIISAAAQAAGLHSAAVSKAAAATPVHPIKHTPAVAVVPNVPLSTVLPANVTTSSISSVASKVAAPVVPVVTASSTLTPNIPFTLSSIPPTSSSPTTSLPVPSVESAQGQGRSSSKGVSSGVIGAIVAVVILLVVGLIAFFVRKMLMRRRAIKRNTWGAGLVPALESKRDTVYAGAQSSQMSETSAGHPVSAFTAPSPPPASYLHNPSPVAAFTPPSIQQPFNKAMPPIPPQPTPGPEVEVAVVARTFIPTLPDELHISNGEHIRVLEAYDDGWALCSNIRGEKGVVPVECLQRSGAPAEMQLQPQSELGYGSEKALKRLSSLTSNAGGTY